MPKNKSSKTPSNAVLSADQKSGFLSSSFFKKFFFYLKAYLHSYLNTYLLGIGCACNLLSALRKYGFFVSEKLAFTREKLVFTRKKISVYTRKN